MKGPLETAKMIFINLLMMEIDSVISKHDTKNTGPGCSKSD